ncbi:MAG: hypothetical protein DRI90_27190 [Deltaproteobacteria bacterium]|nr:MAG: hypothetical protein DRI90_27190 [Deltaproteobacteria bacterium]
MNRIDRAFDTRPDLEREWLQDNTWCDACGEADLGMTSPYEYEQDGRIYVEGQCRRCGRQVRSEVKVENAG